MLRIKPFHAIHPPPHRAASVASVPYDVVNTAEARALADGNPDSFLRVIRSEIDLPDGTPPHDDSVYEKATANFQAMLSDGALVRESEPRIYLYRQVLDHQVQVGVVCCCHVEDYANDVIRKHEKTRPDKEMDRTRHILAIEAQAGPVFLAFRDDPAIDLLITKDMNDRPLFHFNAPDGVTHTVWQVHDPQVYVDAFGRLQCAYVADGHHRTASAARAAAERDAANPGHRGDEEYNWFLSVLFPAGDLTILPYNRVVTDLNGLTPQEFEDRLGQVGSLESTANPEPAEPGRFCVYFDGAWHQLTLDPATIDQSDPIQSLDVELLQSRILAPILGIGDPRTDQRIEFVGGIRGPQELKKRVDDGQAAVGFSLFATSIEQLLAVADVGLIMPPKSTWFEPKLRSGLFVHGI